MIFKFINPFGKEAGVSLVVVFLFFESFAIFFLFFFFFFLKLNLIVNGSHLERNERGQTDQKLILITQNYYFRCMDRIMKVNLLKYFVRTKWKKQSWTHYNKKIVIEEEGVSMTWVFMGLQSKIYVFWFGRTQSCLKYQRR